MTSNPAPIRILAGLREIAPLYGALLCDIWGVVHDGHARLAGATEALARYRTQGGRVVLITNAPRPHGPIRAQLDELLVPHAAYDAIVTSGDVTVELVAQQGDRSVFHIGPPRDLALFEEVAEASGLRPPLAALEHAAYCVCTGLFDDDAETPEDYRPRLERMLARKMPMICANPDIVVHRGSTLIHCAGALAQLYETMGGVAIYAGKPHAPIYARALALAGAQASVLAIGDAAATDLRGAQEQGLDALFVTHGIHRRELHHGGAGALDSARLEAFAQAKGLSPRYAMARLCW